MRILMAGAERASCRALCLFAVLQVGAIPVYICFARGGVLPALVPLVTLLRVLVAQYRICHLFLSRTGVGD